MEMAADDAIAELASKFVGTLTVILNPASQPQDRQAAIKVQDEFMQTSPLCADVGLYFYRNKETFGSDIRLCGLQLVDFFIKSHWNELDPSKQNQLKLEVLKLVKDAEINEPSYLKEIAVKVFIEVVKRTWPQEWETLFIDLNGLQSLGDAQLELVLIIFKVLSEEINGMDDKIKPQRRRDMTQALNTNMAGLFQFFLTTIKNKAMGLQSNSSKNTLRIAQAALETINNYSSWLNFEYLISSEMVLFQVLFFLLEVDELKYLACCCLNTIYERKGQPELRKEFIAAVSPNALEIVQKVARSSNEPAKTDEEEYRFLKKLVEVMTNLGNNHIANLWGDDKGFHSQPDGFLEYSQMMLEFLKHDSLTIVNMAARTWHAFLLNKNIKKSQVCRNAIPAILDCCIKKMAKCGNPFAKNVDGSSCFNAMDFDEYSDYQQKLTGVRTTFSQLLQDILSVEPTLPFEHCLLQINNSLELGFPDTEGLSVDTIKETEHYIYWDSLSVYSKRTVNALFHQYPKKLTGEMLMKCNFTLHKLLQCNCNQPLFNTMLLRIMENLFPVFKYHQDHLLSTMHMIFRLMDVDKKDDKSRIKLQRHACIAFTSICKAIPHILANIFNDLELYILKRLEETNLTNHEKGILLEGLLQISMALKDDRQKQFILKITSFIENNLRKESIHSAINSVVGLVNLLGLGQCAHTESMKNDLSQFLLTLYCWLAIAKVCTVVEFDEMPDNPSDVDLNKIHSKHVWIQPMVNILQQVFELARNYCMVWTAQDQLSSDAKQQLEQTKNDNFTETDFKGGGEQMTRGFSVLYLIHDIIYTCLPLYATCLGPVFYSLPGMAETIVDKLVMAWTNLPNMKLCKIWKNFLKSFISGCPASLRGMSIARVLSVATQATYQRLSGCWYKFQEQMSSVTKSMLESSGGNNESEEVKELKVIYNLSEDYITTLVYLCCYKKEKEKVPEKIEVGRSIGSLGEFLLQCEDTNLHIITSLFSCLTWPHTSLVSRVCELVGPLISHVFTADKLVDANIPKQLYMQLLMALQKHGADQVGLSSLITAALEFYMHMRLTYPSIVDVMLMVPSCTRKDLKAFDLDNFMDDNQLLTEGKKKRRRERFKKLLEGAFGRSVSNLHKSKIEIRDLPAMAVTKKPTKPSLLASNTEEAGLTELFGNR